MTDLQSLRINCGLGLSVLVRPARCGVANEFLVEETLDGKENAAMRAALNGTPVRGEQISSSPTSD
jgi:hypothetical protein